MLLFLSKKFSSLYELKDIGEINSQMGQIKGELKLFYTEKGGKWAQPMLDFIERNSKGLFLSVRTKDVIF